MKVKVIDRRYRGCAVGCDQCHTCRLHEELSWALAQKKLILSDLLAEHAREKEDEEEEGQDEEEDDIPF